MQEFEVFSQSVTNLAITLPRIAAAFLILPLISQENMPPMVRNIFLVSLAIAVFPFIVHEPYLQNIVGVRLIPIALKEIFIGAIIAYSFSIAFWALEGAGQIIDNKVGTTMAQVSDPVSGHQTTLLGKLFSQLASYLFVAFGGLIIFLELLLGSYDVWPIADPLPDMRAMAELFVIDRFGELMVLMLLLAAPPLVALTLVEFGLGFINRYAERLNIFALSLSIKAWLAIFIVLMMLGSIVEFMLGWLGAQRGLLDLLREVS